MIKMTITRITVLVILLGIASAFVSNNGHPLPKVKTAPGKESKKEKPACGPGFIVYNNTNKTIWRMQLVSGFSGITHTVDNPTFPYSFSGSFPGGQYVLYIFSTTPWTAGKSIQVSPGLLEDVECFTLSPNSDWVDLTIYAPACKPYTITINPTPCP